MVHLCLFFSSQIHSFPFLPIRIGLGWNTKKSVLIIKVLSLPKSFTQETCSWTKGAKRAKKEKGCTQNSYLGARYCPQFLFCWNCIWFDLGFRGPPTCNSTTKIIVYPLFCYRIQANGKESEETLTLVYVHTFLICPYQKVVPIKIRVSFLRKKGFLPKVFAFNQIGPTASLFLLMK